MTDQQAKFDGWAVVEILGHQRYAGYVTTEAYGQAVLFRIDVPAIDARERVLKAPNYVGGQYVPAGSTVQEGAVPGYTKLVGSGSIYCITPCTKEAALQAVDAMQPRPLMSVALPPDRALVATGVATASDEDDDEDENLLDDDADAEHAWSRPGREED